MLKDKNQHRIPRVYWRQWAFIDPRTKADTLTVIKRGDPVTHYKRVKTFTTVTNLFDTTLFQAGSERFFDEMCIRTETNYPKVITSLTNNKYDGQTRIYLTEFLSNLFVRQESTFNFFKWIIERENIRKKLFKEIAILETNGDSQLIEQLYEEMIIDPNHSIDSKVSAILVQGWKHFKNAFQRFKHIILKAPVDRHWPTTDNPVIIEGLGNDGWVAGPDAEIYFPISKAFLVYMYIPGGRHENQLRAFPVEQISGVSIAVFDEIVQKKMIKNRPEYFVIGEDNGYYNARTGEFEKGYRPQPIDQAPDSGFNLMDTPLPPNLDDPELERLLVRIKAEYEPVELPVETHPDAQQNECIQIVDKMVNDFGGKRILGWQIWKGAFLIEAEFHAVWETPEGELKDVSVKKKGVGRIVFVEDPKLVYKGKQVNNIRVNLTSEPLVDDFIQVCNIEYKLLNKGKRGTLYGTDLWNTLTKKQRTNIELTVRLKQNLWQLLESGGTQDSMCFCNEGRKYKNCHGKEIKNLHKLN